MGTSFHRGGKPRHINGTTSAGTKDHWPMPGTTVHLWFKNTHASEGITLYMSKADSDASVGVSIAAGAILDIPAEVIEFWTLSTNASSFQAIAFVRP